MTLLPIAPIFLLPFIIVFFIAVFPVWLVAMIVLGAVRSLTRLAIRRADHPARQGIEKAFHWVKTFGGFIFTGEDKPR